MLLSMASIKLFRCDLRLDSDIMPRSCTVEVWELNSSFTFLNEDVVLNYCTYSKDRTARQKAFYYGSLHTTNKCTYHTLSQSINLIAVKQSTSNIFNSF